MVKYMYQTFQQLVHHFHSPTYIHVHVHLHDDLRKKERKKERQAPEANEKMKNKLPQVGFEPTLCTPGRCSYQLIYQ